jgi:hypothetical protein
MSLAGKLMRYGVDTLPDVSFRRPRGLWLLGPGLLKCVSPPAVGIKAVHLSPHQLVLGTGTGAAGACACGTSCIVRRSDGSAAHIGQRASATATRCWYWHSAGAASARVARRVLQ